MCEERKAQIQQLDVDVRNAFADELTSFAQWYRMARYGPWSLMNSSLFGTGCSGKILRSLCVKIEEEFATLRQDLEGFQMERD